MNDIATRWKPGLVELWEQETKGRRHERTSHIGEDMKGLLISAAALISFASVAQAEEPKASRSDIMAAYHSLTREEAKIIRRELAKLSRNEREALSRAYAGYSRAQIRDAMRAFAAPRISGS